MRHKRRLASHKFTYFIRQHQMLAPAITYCANPCILVLIHPPIHPSNLSSAHPFSHIDATFAVLSASLGCGTRPAAAAGTRCARMRGARGARAWVSAVIGIPRPAPLTPAPVSLRARAYDTHTRARRGCSRRWTRLTSTWPPSPPPPSRSPPPPASAGGGPRSHVPHLRSAARPHPRARARARDTHAETHARARARTHCVRQRVRQQRAHAVRRQARGAVCVCVGGGLFPAWAPSPPRTDELQGRAVRRDGADSVGWGVSGQRRPARRPRRRRLWRLWARPPKASRVRMVAALYSGGLQWRPPRVRIVAALYSGCL